MPAAPESLVVHNRGCDCHCFDGIRRRWLKHCARSASVSIDHRRRSCNYSHLLLLCLPLQVNGRHLHQGDGSKHKRSCQGTRLWPADGDQWLKHQFYVDVDHWSNYTLVHWVLHFNLYPSISNLQVLSREVQAFRGHVCSPWHHHSVLLCFPDHLNSLDCNWWNERIWSRLPSTLGRMRCISKAIINGRKWNEIVRKNEGKRTNNGHSRLPDCLTIGRCQGLSEL